MFILKIKNLNLKNLVHLRRSTIADLVHGDELICIDSIVSDEIHFPSNHTVVQAWRQKLYEKVIFIFLHFFN